MLTVYYAYYIIQPDNSVIAGEISIGDKDQFLTAEKSRMRAPDYADLRCE